MSIDRSKRITFDQIADIYNESRPHYAEALIEDIIALSGIPAEGRILEVGCGPGNATLPFARRGYRITAVELGVHMTELARHNLRDYPKVEIINSAFEDWTMEEEAFDLALSADALHWIPPEISYPRLARTLKEGGSVALFWHSHVDPQTEWSRAVEEVYARVAPEVENPDKSYDADWLVGIISENFAKCGCYGPLTVRRYDRQVRLSREVYLKRLRTYSSHSDIEAGLRSRLYTAIGEVIDRYGGEVSVPEMTMLFVAQRNTGF